MRVETIGNATLYLGDCLEILPTLEKVEAVITDPPYGVTYQSNAATGKGTIPITNDGTRISLSVYRRLVRLLPKNVPVLWFTRWDAWPDVWEILASQLPVKGLLVWDKGTPGMGDLSHWGCSHELIASAGEIKLRGSRDSSILRFNGVPSGNRHHPTEKPVELFKYLVGKVTDAEQTVVDPFMGSGTTGVACMDINRKFVGIEIERNFFDIACERVAAAQSQGRLFA